mgnify:CR=1 FL=1
MTSKYKLFIEDLLKNYDFYLNNNDVYIKYDVEPTAIPLSSDKGLPLLKKEYYDYHGTMLSDAQLKHIVDIIKADLIQKGREKPVFTRLGQDSSNIYLDFCNQRAGIAKISESRLKKVRDSPILFHRPGTMLPLPAPKKPANGGLDKLQRLLNMNNDDFKTVCLWLIGALSPTGPYPPLNIQGEQGTAKSTTSKFLKMLLDPSKPNLRSLPESERDLVIGAQRNWILAFDNISNISPKMSDALCRLSTGGGLATRKLYTDAEEVTLEVKRPIILNGIGEIIHRPDLASRTLIVELPVINEKQRVTEDELNKKFQKYHPRILRTLLEAASSSLKHFDNIELDRSPRMIDFAKWAVAGAKYFGWDKDETLSILEENWRRSSSACLQGDIVGTAIHEFIEEEGNWSGSVSELKDEIERTNPGVKHNSYWPQSPTSFSKRMRRMNPAFRDFGIQIENLPRTKKEGRKIMIKK